MAWSYGHNMLMQNRLCRDLERFQTGQMKIVAQMLQISTCDADLFAELCNHHNHGLVVWSYYGHNNNMQCNAGFVVVKSVFTQMVYTLDCQFSTAFKLIVGFKENTVGYKEETFGVGDSGKFSKFAPDALSSAGLTLWCKFVRSTGPG